MDDVDGAAAPAESPVVTPEADASPVDATPGAESAPAAPETSVPPEDKLQARFDKLTREKYDALREVDYWRDRAQRPTEAKAPTAPVAPVAPPTLEGNGFDEAKYKDAERAYLLAEAERIATAKLDAFKSQTAAEARQKQFKERETQFIAKTADYEEKARDRTLPISEAMADLIESSDLGPQLLYHLANNRDVARLIYDLPKEAAAREFGRIEGRLSIAPPAPKPNVSKAPPPPPKIDAVDVKVTKDIWDPTLSDAEFNKRRREAMSRRK